MSKEEFVQFIKENDIDRPKNIIDKWIVNGVQKDDKPFGLMITLHDHGVAFSLEKTSRITKVDDIGTLSAMEMEIERFIGADIEDDVIYNIELKLHNTNNAFVFFTVFMNKLNQLCRIELVEDHDEFVHIAI